MLVFSRCPVIWKRLWGLTFTEVSVQLILLKGFRSPHIFKIESTDSVILGKFDCFSEAQFLQQ